MSIAYLWVRLSSGVMKSSLWTVAIWCGLQSDRRRTVVSIKINARLWDLFAVTWKTLPGKTVWIQGTSSPLDSVPPAADPKLAPWSLLSLFLMLHTHTHTYELSFSARFRIEVCKSAHPLSYSLYNLLKSTSPLHTHTQQLQLDFNERLIVEEPVGSVSATCHHLCVVW